MDEDVRGALVEICDVLRQKVKFDTVRRRDDEMVDEAKRLSTQLDEMIEKLKDRQ